MKYFMMLTGCFLLLILPAGLFNVSVLPEKEITKDKDFLLNYYEETYEELENQVKNLSETQLSFKPSSEQWSVSETLEHIVLTEKAMFPMIAELLKKPLDETRKEEIKDDQELISMLENRDHKVKTSEELTPSGKYRDSETALQDLKNQRKQILDLIERTDLQEMRNHIGDSPFGAVDAYQNFLFLAGHTARHTLQIAEIKADENFPSEKI